MLLELQAGVCSSNISSPEVIVTFLCLGVSVVSFLLSEVVGALE